MLPILEQFVPLVEGDRRNEGRIWGISRDSVGSLTLTDMHHIAILMHMRTTLIIDDKLLKRAQEITGIAEKTAVVHAGLDALIARESARRLAALGGTERKLKPVRRRRPSIQR